GSWDCAEAVVESGGKPKTLNCSSKTVEQLGAVRSSSSSSAQSNLGSSGVPTRGLGSGFGKRVVPKWLAQPVEAMATRLMAASASKCLTLVPPALKTSSGHHGLSM